MHFCQHLRALNVNGYSCIVILDSVLESKRGSIAICCNAQASKDQTLRVQVSMEPSKLIQVRSSSIAACASACELIYCYCNHLYLEQRHSSQALPVVPTGMPHAVRRLAANGELSLSLLRSAAAYACGTHPTSNVPLQRLYSTVSSG